MARTGLGIMRFGMWQDRSDTPSDERCHFIAAVTMGWQFSQAISLVRYLMLTMNCSYNTNRQIRDTNTGNLLVMILGMLVIAGSILHHYCAGNGFRQNLYLLCFVITQPTVPCPK